jgi:membrane protein
MIYMIQYIRSVVLSAKPVQLLIQTGLKWQRDNCSGMAAALSYYALFSLFPTLLVVLSILGSLVAPNTATYQSITKVVERSLPVEVHDLVKGTIISLNQSSVGAGTLGFIVLLFAASTIFSVLSHSVDKIWQSDKSTAESQSLHGTLMSFLLKKIWTVSLVFGTLLLLLVSLMLDIVIKLILELVTYFQKSFDFIKLDELPLTQGLELSSSLFVLTLFICILFKILPSSYVGWGDVWLGALITAMSLLGLQQLVSNSVITIGSHFLSYGAVGIVMILLLWLYITWQIFLIGCEFSCVYAHLYGSRRRKAISSS